MQFLCNACSGLVADLASECRPFSFLFLAVESKPIELLLESCSWGAAAGELLLGTCCPNLMAFARGDLLHPPTCHLQGN